MHATQPKSVSPLKRPAVSPVARRRISRSAAPAPRPVSPQILGWEIGIKLSVYSILSLAAISGLVRLVPYHQTVQARLEEVEQEVQRVETRVNRLHSEFNSSFDPNQAKRLMQEQGHRIDPRQRPVIWIEGKSANVEQPAVPYVSAYGKNQSR
ncbi:hypothetical protein H6G20_26405 [Desertifilum sp. FACHB-1129]|uniref:Uncharacterized protein n=2 Tax=Desertifilum tharense IPPAS B-1220 TaxID=1781255 RepID=A0A1E5QCS5_9CYAN|nr:MULTISPECIES: hypothetical protein [Cyanophyceae]MDA0209483.1 hypothetical protein [Cyanobacteria bacterium FC1]MBD2315203.1 hypothetical protein [Desertifilum sp. FACHB-1129]MBD2321057.1 hypothetical protein [Desertifilum sp. FACHB-866]MBD2331186.1 hypothetical protein [Desertifilum sp. FACHB-868]MDL5052392.1 hypothetical protein [Oscillatoria laete-virens NRMC-F 0139]